ncbi:hypothetical protein TIFTF001_031484 [Ficus carica]|uniref:Uncharacterized protein n=1 Tax=Ficus carica TaxID=3494 RepID=A0AA88DVD4_FICCA|nr:hypothetical protein TIFTF001_031484 [Ficus carica]
MSCTRTTLSRSHFWVLLRISPTPSANPRIRLISSSSNQQSFTVSYLINSIGLCPKTALSASKHVNIKSPEKPDKVVELFRSYGFTRTQISSLVRVFPAVLVSDTKKTILPKLEFLKAKGISGPDMAKKLCLFPTLLKSSLVKQIMPSYVFYRNLFQSDGKVVAVVKRYPDVLTFSLKKYVSPNIDILRRHGVPDAKICILMLNWPICVMATHDRFQKVLKKVEDMGFHASKLNFVLAVVALRTRDEAKWQSKVDAYKKWGCSEEDVLKAFYRFPWCMMISENKLMAGMDFFINQMGLRPCFIVKHSRLLSQSLKKRIIPRFSVFEVLLSKGLVKKDVSLRQLFQVSDKKFLQNFVTPYKEEAPELLKLYKEKMNLSNGPLVDKI